MKIISHSAFYLAFLFLANLAGTMAAESHHDHLSFIRRHPFPKFRLEKLSHIRVFCRETSSGINATAVSITPPAALSSNSGTGFGAMVLMDDPLTARPELDSALVGRAQGMYALTSQEEVGMLMCMNFAFMTGKYNGSTITILGRNMASSEVREMPVIGGSGLFRWASGYAQARTYSIDITTSNTIVEYNVIVRHY